MACFETTRTPAGDTGAQPSGCRSVEDEVGAETCRRGSLIPCFCSLKAAFLSAIRDGAQLIFPAGLGREGDAAKLIGSALHTLAGAVENL